RRLGLADNLMGCDFTFRWSARDRIGNLASTKLTLGSFHPITFAHRRAPDSPGVSMRRHFSIADRDEARWFQELIASGGNNAPMAGAASLRPLFAARGLLPGPVTELLSDATQTAHVSPDPAFQSWDPLSRAVRTSLLQHVRQVSYLGPLRET